MAYFLWSVRSDVPVCRPVRASRVIVVAVTLAASVAAGCGRDKRLHVSDDFRTRLSGVLTTIQTDLRASCQSGPDDHAFKEVVGSLQKKLRAMFDDRKTPAEYAAQLHVGYVFHYERGRCEFLGTNQPALIAELESFQQECISELKPWLENTASEANYDSSRCLRKPKRFYPTLFELE
jgi:hypothetical protein